MAETSLDRIRELHRLVNEINADLDHSAEVRADLMDLVIEAERVVEITASHCPPGCTPDNCIQRALLAKLKARRSG